MSKRSGELKLGLTCKLCSLLLENTACNAIHFEHVYSLF